MGYRKTPEGIEELVMQNRNHGRMWGYLAVLCLILAFVNLAIWIVSFGNHHMAWVELANVPVWIVLAFVCLVFDGRVTHPMADRFTDRSNFSRLAKIWTEMGPELRVRKWLAASLLGLGIGFAILPPRTQALPKSGASVRPPTRRNSTAGALTYLVKEGVVVKAAFF